MSETRPTAGGRRHRRRRRRDRDLDGLGGSDYSIPATDTASGTTTTRTSQPARHRRGREDNALVMREQYHVQLPPKPRDASASSDEYEEYTVGADGGGPRQQRYRDKNRAVGREQGLLLAVAAFVVALVFCLRETRSRGRR